MGEKQNNSSVSDKVFNASSRTAFSLFLIAGLLLFGIGSSIAELWRTPKKVSVEDVDFGQLMGFDGFMADSLDMGSMRRDEAVLNARLDSLESLRKK